MNVDTIKRAAADRWPQLLAAVAGIPAEALDGKHHPCPKCGGTDRFRLVDEAAGAVYCNQCFKTGNGDGLAAIQWATGCDFQTACKLIADHLGVNAAKPSIVAAYDFRDEQGELLYQVVRYEPKNFRQRRPKPGGGWDWKLGNVRRALYRLPELLAADAAAPVFICEGEKDCDRLAALGLVATTNAGGAEKWKTEYNAALRNRHVVLLPDHDAPGEKHAALVAAALQGIAASVRIVHLPGLPDKGDVSDWLNAGGTRDELLRLASEDSQAATSEPSASPGDELTYKPFPVDCLPPPIGRYVAEAAKSIGCDPVMVALPMLASLAAAIGNTRRIELKTGDYREVSILWTAIVCESGQSKTPAIKAATNFLAQLETESTRHVVGDVTREGLAGLLKTYPRGLLLVRDELAGWMSFGEYKAAGKAGGDVAFWLSLHSGDAIRIDRKGKDKETGKPESLTVPVANCSITGGIQPDALRRALGVENFENGLAARLLLAYPPRRLQLWTEDVVDPALKAEVAEVFRKLVALDFAGNICGSVDLPMTPGGKAAWIDFFNRQIREGFELSGKESALWSKLRCTAARMALMFHCIRQVTGDPTLTSPDSVDEGSVAAGIALADWFGKEGLRIYSLLAIDEEGESEPAREFNLADYVRQRGGKVTPRQLCQAMRRYRANTPLAEAELQQLVDRNLGTWQPSGKAKAFVLAT